MLLDAAVLPGVTSATVDEEDIFSAKLFFFFNMDKIAFCANDINFYP